MRICINIQHTCSSLLCFRVIIIVSTNDIWRVFWWNQLIRFLVVLIQRTKWILFHNMVIYKYYSKRVFWCGKYWNVSTFSLVNIFFMLNSNFNTATMKNWSFPKIYQNKMANFKNKQCTIRTQFLPWNFDQAHYLHVFWAQKTNMKLVVNIWIFKFPNRGQ